MLEYFTGVVMEKLFKVRYWDYSDKPFNFQGQICLTSTLAWGALSVVLIGFLHPPVENFVLRRIPRIPSIVLAAALSAVFVTDFAVSFRDAWGLGRILEKMTALKAEIAVLETHLRDLRQEQQDRLSGLKEGSAQWLLDRREEYAGRLHALRNDTLGWLSDFHNAKPSRLVEAKRSLDELTDPLYGEIWEPSTFSSFLSPMMDQSSVVGSANTENSTKVPSLRIICIPCTTEAGWPVASI